jgi:hypothetical protein
MHNFKYHKKRYILAIFFILLLVFLLLYWQGTFENKALKSALYWEQQGRVRVADSLKRVVTDTKVTGETSQDSVVRFEAEKLDGGDSGNMYFIIIGSFINTENANLAARQYHSQGYITSIIRTTNRNGNKAELVSVKTFSNYDEAVKYLKEFQNKVDSKAWLYPNLKTKLH